MSKLSNLLGKGKEVVIGGETFLFEPLSIQDIELILNLEDDNKRAESMKKIITKTLKKSVPDATDEEIDNIGIQHFKEITEAILSINGMKHQDVNKE